MSLTPIQIVIDATNRTGGAFASVNKGLDGIAQQAKSLEPTFRQMAVAGAAVFTAISAEATLAIRAFADAEQKTIRMAASLDNFARRTGLAKGGLASLTQQVVAYGENAQRVLGFDNELVSQSFAKLVNTMGNVEQAQKAVGLAMDLARAKGIDLASATDIVNLAMQGSPKLLRQFGIELEDNASRAEILAALMEAFGGTAEKAAGSAAVSMERLNNQVSDLQEAIGAALVPAMTDLVNAITPVILAATEWAQKNPELVATLFDVGLALSGLIAALGTIGLLVPKVILGFKLLIGVLAAIGAPMLLVIGFIALCTAGLIWLYKNTDLAKAKMKEWADILKTNVAAAIDYVIGKLEKLFNLWVKISSLGILKYDTKENKVKLNFASGGVVPGKLGAPVMAMVHGGERIMPAHGLSLAGMGGYGGGIQLTINADVVAGDAGIRDLADKVGDVLMRALRQNTKMG